MHISARGCYYASLQVSSNTLISPILSLKDPFYIKDYTRMNKVNNTARAGNLNIPTNIFCWGITAKMNSGDQARNLMLKNNSNNNNKKGILKIFLLGFVGFGFVSLLKSLPFFCGRDI